MPLTSNLITLRFTLILKRSSTQSIDNTPIDNTILYCNPHISTLSQYMEASPQQHPRNLRPRLPEMWRYLSVTSSIELLSLMFSFKITLFRTHCPSWARESTAERATGLEEDTLWRNQNSPPNQGTFHRSLRYGTSGYSSDQQLRSSLHEVFFLFQGQPVRKPPRQLDGYVGFANLPNQVIISSLSCFEQGHDGWNVAEWCI